MAFWGKPKDVGLPREGQNEDLFVHSASNGRP